MFRVYGRVLYPFLSLTKSYLLWDRSIFSKNLYFMLFAHYNEIRTFWNKDVRVLRKIIYNFKTFHVFRPFGNLGIGISASAMTSALVSAPALQNFVFALRNFFGKREHLCPLDLSILPCVWLFLFLNPEVSIDILEKILFQFSGLSFHKCFEKIAPGKFLETTHQNIFVESFLINSQASFGVV